MLPYIAVAMLTFAATLYVTLFVFFWLGFRGSTSVGFLTAQRSMGFLFTATDVAAL